MLLYHNVLGFLLKLSASGVIKYLSVYFLVINFGFLSKQIDGLNYIIVVLATNERMKLRDD